MIPDPLVIWMSRPPIRGAFTSRKNYNRLLCDMDSTPEVHLEHRPSRVVRSALYLPEYSVSRVVEDHVQTAERLSRPLESIEDLFRDRDVDFEREQLLGRILVLEVFEYLGLA